MVVLLCQIELVLWRAKCNAPRKDATSPPQKKQKPPPRHSRRRRESSYGYVVTRSVTQPRRKPRYFGGEAADCVRQCRTAYLSWIPASLNCSSFPPSAEMTNMSGENDGCLLFRRPLTSSFLQKTPNPSSSPARREKIAGSDFSRA